MKNLLFLLLAMVLGCSEPPKSPEQIRAELQLSEQKSPTTYLEAGGTYRQNLWGSNYTIDGTIKNSAAIANFKDAVIQVVYYTKTKTELKRSSFIVYDYFPANTTKSFKLKIDKIDGTETIGWSVANASVY